MKRIVLLLVAAVATLPACRDQRPREVATADSLARRLDVPADTLAPVPLPDSARRAGAAPPPESPLAPKSRIAAPTTRPAKSSRAAPGEPTRARRGTETVARATRSERDSVPGYRAPAPPDTSAPAAAAPDTIDTLDARGTVSPVETTTPESAAAPPPDTSVRRRVPAPPPSPAPAADRARPADTVTAPAESTATPPAANAAPAPATSAPPSDTTAAATGTGTASRTLPAGTEIRAVLQDSLSSRRNTAGQRLDAEVIGDVRPPGGQTLVPSGSHLWLTVKRLAPARSRSAKDGELELTVDSVTAGGKVLPIQATVQPIPHELVGRGVTAGEAEKVAAGAAVGAAAGRVIGGNTKGAVVGGVVGAAGGTAVAVQTASRDVVVKAGTQLVLVLTTPFTP